MARGWMSEEESRFSFAWGVLLQLGDDLQDLHEDMQRGSVTLFTQAAAMGIPLDALVVQLLNFSDRVASQMDELEGRHRDAEEIDEDELEVADYWSGGECSRIFQPSICDGSGALFAIPL